MPFKEFYHTNGSGLKDSQKHQLCDDALTNVRPKEAKSNKEKEKGNKWRKGSRVSAFVND